MNRKLKVGYKEFLKNHFSFCAVITNVQDTLVEFIATADISLR